MLWVLNGSDGSTTLLDIAERANIPFSAIHAAAIDLKEVGLLRTGHSVDGLTKPRENDCSIHRHGCDPPYS